MQIISHPRLRKGMVFIPRFYPKAITRLGLFGRRVNAKLRRIIAGQPKYGWSMEFHPGARPKMSAKQKRRNARRRARRLTHEIG